MPTSTMTKAATCGARREQTHCFHESPYWWRRPDGEDLVYTHEFLADMMGISRKSVTLAAQTMQAAGLITYRRGKMQVLDRPGLEQAACECYAVVRERFDAFLTPPPTAVQNNVNGRK